MMAQSDDIMRAWTDSIIGLKPALVLIAGDLTYNGERLSHERMVQHLDRMAAHGIQPLVIPGNHDCNNPYAVRFEGDATVPTATVTRDEFAQIYRDYGYGSTSRRDPASLSYCCEPIKGLVIIGIDSNMDELNTLTARGDSANSYHNGGRIKPETLQWVIDRATEASSKGKRVIAMMHHHLVPHFDQQERLLANYIVKDHDNISSQLMQAGIHTIFTGHLHVTDAATRFSPDKTDSIVEVATGSAICYPFAVRVATFDGKRRTLDIDTRWLSATSTCADLREQGRQRMLEVGGGKVELPETPQQATQLVLRHLSEVFSRTLLAVVEGNEQECDVQDIISQGKHGVRAMIEEVAPDQAEALWNFFDCDVYPQIEPLVRSILEDRNAVGIPTESHTDDLRLSIKL